MKKKKRNFVRGAKGVIIIISSSVELGERLVVANIKKLIKKLYTVSDKQENQVVKMSFRQIHYYVIYSLRSRLAGVPRGWVMGFCNYTPRLLS